MRKLMMAMTVMAVMAGCKSVDVDRRAQSLATVRNADGSVEVVRDAAGNPLVLDGGWSAEYFQHWNWQEFDSLTAKAGSAELAINGYRGGADATNLTALVATSFDGAANLAAKVGAAIATSGGSAARDAVSGLIARFLKAGGDAGKASVTCADGSCTITDGSITCTDGSCYEK